MIINHRTCEKPLPFDGLIVEIGFGRGDFLIETARKYPEKTILGFELSGISIEKAHSKLKKEGIGNVLLINMDAFWGFHFLLMDESVEKIYMNFPDPWFKKRHFKRRLTSIRNLNMFAKKLKQEGFIRILTDYLPFALDTLESATETGLFKTELRRVDRPSTLTKYAIKALEGGRKIYEIILIRLKKPECEETSVKEARNLFPKKFSSKPGFKEISNREFRIRERVVLKTGDIIGDEDKSLIECLLSEEGFVQKFFIEIKRKGEEYLIDISPYSEVIRTENLQFAVDKLGEMIFKP